MKLKNTKLLFIVALIILMPLISANATSYSVDISQSPKYPQADTIVTITVDVIDPQLNEEFNSAQLKYWLNGLTYIIDPEPPFDSIQDVQLITFVIGPFDKNDFIEYYVLLEFVYADNYQSEWYSFNVGDKKPKTPLTDDQIIYIVVGSVVGFVLLAVVLVVIMNRRKK